MSGIFYVLQSCFEAVNVSKQSNETQDGTVNEILPYIGEDVRSDELDGDEYDEKNLFGSNQDYYE